MHFWKLLASFAIRYHLLQNPEPASNSSELAVNETVNDISNLTVWMTNATAELKKIWEEEILEDFLKTNQTNVTISAKIQSNLTNIKHGSSNASVLPISSSSSSSKASEVAAPANRTVPMLRAMLHNPFWEKFGQNIEKSKGKK